MGGIMSITIECRDEVYKTRPTLRRLEILDVLNGNSMTARGIAIKLGYNDLNQVKPRLTSMVQDNTIEVVGKTKDFLTGRTVSVYKVTD